jgi:hypothetical protein
VPTFAALALAGQRRSVMPVSRTAWLRFEPLLQQANVRGTADAVGPLDDDQLAFQLTGLYGREALAIEFKSTHRRILSFLAPVSALVTIARICICCSSIERLASITTRPHSWTIRSYSSMTAP